MRTQKILVTAFVAILASTIAWAQAPRFESVTIDSSGYPQIRAELDLRNSLDEWVLDPPDAGIRIVEGTQDVTGQLTIAPDPDGVAFVVALDVSKSMRRWMGTVREFLITLFAGLGERDLGAIVIFSDRPTVWQPRPDTDRPFTADKTLLVNAVNDLEVSGNSTELFFAAYKALQLLQAPELPTRRVLLVISDGKNGGVNYTLEDCVDLATKERVKIVSLGVASSSPPALLNMQRLAERSSGFYWVIDSDTVWLSQVGKVISHIRNRQTLTWRTTLPRDGDTHPVRIKAVVDGRQVEVGGTVKVPAALPVPPPESVWSNPYVILGVAVGAFLLIAAIVILMIIFFRGRKRERVILDDRAKQQERIQEDFERIRQELNQGLQSIQGGRSGTISSHGGSEVATAIPQVAQQRRQTVFKPSGRDQPAEAYQSAWIEIVDGARKGQKFALGAGETTIGREPGNSIVLDEGRVSSSHARIRSQNGQFWVEDLGSTNGTYLENGERLAQPHRLFSGELVRVGGVVVRFRGKA